MALFTEEYYDFDDEEDFDVELPEDDGEEYDYGEDDYTYDDVDYYDEEVYTDGVLYEFHDGNGGTGGDGSEEEDEELGTLSDEGEDEPPETGTPAAPAADPEVPGPPAQPAAAGGAMGAGADTGMDDIDGPDEDLGTLGDDGEDLNADGTAMASADGGAEPAMAAAGPDAGADTGAGMDAGGGLDDIDGPDEDLGTLGDDGEDLNADGTAMASADGGEAVASDDPLDAGADDEELDTMGDDGSFEGDSQMDGDNVVGDGGNDAMDMGDGADGDAGGESLGGDSGGGLDGGDPNGGTGEPVDPYAKIKELENDIYDALSPEEKIQKETELKNIYLQIAGECDMISRSIREAPKSDLTVKTYEQILQMVDELKVLSIEYVETVFAKRPYLNNLMNSQKYMSVLAGVRDQLDLMADEQEKALDNKN